jgi:hypothetical protein
MTNRICSQSPSAVSANAANHAIPAGIAHGLFPFPCQDQVRLGGQFRAIFVVDLILNRPREIRAGSQNTVTSKVLAGDEGFEISMSRVDLGAVAQGVAILVIPTARTPLLGFEAIYAGIGWNEAAH